MKPIHFIATADPLLRNPSLDHALELPVLGIRIRFETNSRDVLALINATFAEWGPIAHTAPVAASVRIVVHDHREGVDGRLPVRYISAEDGRLLIHSAGSVAIVDPARRESLAYVSAELVAESEHFRVTMLEAITFALLACFDRHPVHAAGIARDGHAVLLAAPSGTGKSTLSYLAHAAGFDVLGDDRVWVQLEPSLRIWGGPTRIRLAPETSSNLQHLEIVATAADGKLEIVVSRQGTGDAADFTCARATVAVLARGVAVSLERLPPHDIAKELHDQLAAGFDRFPERHQRVVQALTVNGGWRLTLSNDPRDALPLLRTLLGQR